VFVIAHATRAPTLGDILYNIFGIAMCIPVACYPLRWFLGTERLRVGPDCLDYQSRALIPLQERHVPLGEIKGIDYSLKIETLGKPVRFGQFIEPRERRWLADLLQRHLQALMPDRVITLQPDLGAVTKLTVPIEVLGPAGATPEPPSDCAIRLYTDRDRIEFVRRRAFSLVSYGFTSLSHPVLRLQHHLSHPRYTSRLVWHGRPLRLPLGAQAFLVPALLPEPLLGHRPLRVPPGLLCAANHPLLG
jgi:hypothetical protein